MNSYLVSVIYLYFESEVLFEVLDYEHKEGQLDAKRLAHVSRTCDVSWDDIVADQLQHEALHLLVSHSFHVSVLYLTNEHLMFQCAIMDRHQWMTGLRMFCTYIIDWFQLKRVGPTDTIRHLITPHYGSPWFVKPMGALIRRTTFIFLQPRLILDFLPMI